MTLAAALPEEAVTVVLGWPELTAQAIHRRGDLRVRVVDVHGEGGALADALGEVGVDAVDVPESGLGAAVAEADAVVIEALAMGPGGLVAVAGSRAAAAVARHAGIPVWAVGRGGPAAARPAAGEALLGRLEAGGEPWDADARGGAARPVDIVAGPVGHGDHGRGPGPHRLPGGA